MDKELKEHGKELRERMYQFIIAYVTNNGYSPSISEIGDSVGLKSKSSVRSHLMILETDGKIKVKIHSPRAIKVIGYEFRKVED